MKKLDRNLNLINKIITKRRLCSYKCDWYIYKICVLRTINHIIVHFSYINIGDLNE